MRWGTAQEWQTATQIWDNLYKTYQTRKLKSALTELWQTSKTNPDVDPFLFLQQKGLDPEFALKGAQVFNSFWEFAKKKEREQERERFVKEEVPEDLRTGAKGELLGLPSTASNIFKKQKEERDIKSAQEYGKNLLQNTPMEWKGVISPLVNAGDIKGALQLYRDLMKGANKPAIITATDPSGRVYRFNVPMFKYNDFAQQLVNRGFTLNAATPVDLVMYLPNGQEIKKKVMPADYNEEALRLMKEYNATFSNPLDIAKFTDKVKTKQTESLMKRYKAIVKAILPDSQIIATDNLNAWEDDYNKLVNIISNPQLYRTPEGKRKINLATKALGMLDAIAGGQGNPPSVFTPDIKQAAINILKTQAPDKFKEWQGITVNLQDGTQLNQLEYSLNKLWEKAIEEAKGEPAKITPIFFKKLEEVIKKVKVKKKIEKKLKKAKESIKRKQREKTEKQRKKVLRLLQGMPIEYMQKGEIPQEEFVQ